MERRTAGPRVGSGRSGQLRSTGLAAELGLHHVAQAGAAALLLLAEVLAVVLALVEERLHRQRDLTVLRVDVDDLDVDRLALAHDVARVLHALVLELGDVDQTLDARLDLDEGAEVGDLRDLAVHAAAHRGALGERVPGIRLELLDAEAEPLVLDVDVENDGLDLVTLLEHLARVLDALGPADVGDVHEAVHALLDADEDAEVGDVADLALDDGADRVLVLEERPGVLLDLLHAERDALGLRIDVQ